MQPQVTLQHDAPEKHETHEGQSLPYGAPQAADHDAKIASADHGAPANNTTGTSHADGAANMREYDDDNHTTNEPSVSSAHTFATDIEGAEATYAGNVRSERADDEL
jgi:hypothetical protein